jgi:hypothetical protein
MFVQLFASKTVEKFELHVEVSDILDQYVSKSIFPEYFEHNAIASIRNISRNCPNWKLHIKYEQT